MLLVPPCRHRGPEFAPGRFVCHSPRVIVPLGASADICARQCWCVDHPLAGGEPEAARQTTAPMSDARPHLPAGSSLPTPATADRRGLDGVVIGAYDSLSGGVRYGVEAVRLNLSVLRAVCPPETPVLVCDDCSPPASQRRFREICEKFQAEFHSNPIRWGHTSGDMAAYFHGLAWARKRGLQTLTKLSQRMIIDAPGWLAEDAARLLASGCATQAQLLANYPADQVRTECVMMRVDAWTSPAVCEHLRPRRIPVWNEGHIWNAIQRLIDPDRPYPKFLPWPRLSFLRGGDLPPVYFRDMAGDAAGRFHRLARKYGVPLASGFSTADSARSDDYSN